MSAEKLYECEVKRRRLNPAKNGYEWFWKTRSVQDALDDGDAEYRCKDCHGAVKLRKRKVPTGAASHAEHKHRSDSEYCAAGTFFLEATDGREARMSEDPVK